MARTLGSNQRAIGGVFMSNLGGYQTITRVIKSLGGPAKALVAELPAWYGLPSVVERDHAEG